MRVSKNKIYFLLFFFLILNTKIFGEIQISLHGYSTYFSKEVLLQGLNLAKLQLQLTQSYLHQQYSTKLMDIDFISKHSKATSEVKIELSYKKKVLEVSYDEKTKFLKDGDNRLTKYNSLLKESNFCVLKNVFEFLAQTLCRIVLFLPDFNFFQQCNGFEILNKKKLKIICEQEEMLKVDFGDCCKIIDKFFEINNNLLGCFPKDCGFFQNTFRQGVLYKPECCLTVCDCE